jgi:hypothetical protein
MINVESKMMEETMAPTMQGSFPDKDAADLFEDIPKPTHFTILSWLRYEASIWLFEFIAHFIVVMAALLALWHFFIQRSETNTVNNEVNAQIGTQLQTVLDTSSVPTQAVVQTSICRTNAPLNVSLLQQAFQGESQVTTTANLCVQQSTYAILATMLGLFFLCLYVGIRKIGLFAFRNLFILLTVGAAVALFELHMVNHVVPHYVPCMETDMQAAMIEGLQYTPSAHGHESGT